MSGWNGMIGRRREREENRIGWFDTERIEKEIRKDKRRK